MCVFIKSDKFFLPVGCQGTWSVTGNSGGPVSNNSCLDGFMVLCFCMWSATVCQTPASVWWTRQPVPEQLGGVRLRSCCLEAGPGPIPSLPGYGVVPKTYPFLYHFIIIQSLPYTPGCGVVGTQTNPYPEYPPYQGLETGTQTDSVPH